MSLFYLETSILQRTHINSTALVIGPQYSMVENNFFKAIKHAITLCQFLGLLPISKIGTNKVTLFRYYWVYNTILLSLSIWLVLEISVLVMQQNIVEVITDITLIVVNELQLTVTFAKAILGTKSWLNLVYAVLKTDKLFADLNVQLPDKKLNIKMHTYFATRFIFIVFALMFELYFNPPIASYAGLIYSFLLPIFNSVLNCSAALYVIRIHDGFETLNGLIKERVDANADFNFTVPLKDFLPTASRIHHSLTEIIRKFNESYGIILLATVTASFLDIVLCLHESYNALKFNDTHAVINCGAFCCFYIFNMFILCHLCEVTIEKVKSFFLCSL